MIYFVGLISGFVNGFFASGAGNIIILYLVFILKIDSHVGRTTSIAVLCITSIFSIFGLRNIVNFEFDKIILIICISGICGIIGSKIMNKIDSKILNLVSGIIVVSLAICGLSR
ncbi:MAG: TSUP family transporter [Clostridia bacterium]|nr:TSUP family transporter [Clostridia bacterium]MDD4386441.1 TSUP family transporter [Clostridia bacterium]